MKHCPNARGTTYDRKKKRLFPKRCKIRTCPFCSVVRAHRIKLQLDEEQVTVYMIVDHTEWKSCRKKLKRNDVPYISFPLPAGRVVACRYGDLPIPPVSDIVAWVVDSIPGRRISASRGFGGDHAKARAEPDLDRYTHSGKDIGTVIMEIRDEVELRHKQESEAIENIDPTSDMIIRLPDALNQDVEGVMSV